MEIVLQDSKLNSSTLENSSMIKKESSTTPLLRQLGLAGLLGIACLIAFAQAAQAQAQPSYQEVERHSKYLFLDELNKELVAYGDTALAAGQDYFALRYRLGAANYKLGRYAAAAKHFRKAHDMNSGEVETMEYLYFSLFYSGQRQAAQLLIKEFPSALREKLQLKPNDPVVGLNLEAGAKISSDTTAVGNMGFLTANLFHQFTPRLQFSQGISVLSQGIRDGNYRQFQYYAAPKYYLGKGFSLNAAWHILHISGKRTFVGPANVMPPQGGWPSGVFSSTANLIHIGASYQAAYFQAKVFANKTFFSNSEQLGPPRLSVDSTSTFSPMQVGLGIDLNPPVWKQRLFLSTVVAAHNFEGTRNLLFSQSLGVLVTPKLFLEARYMRCGTTFFNEFDGTLINNTSDPMQSRFTGIVNFGLNSRVGIYGMYQLELKTSATTGSDYHYNNIITGINIKL
jgi:tetratricopeptide (TPR) repeat protein